jgi:hypothetical protein
MQEECRRDRVLLLAGNKVQEVRRHQRLNFAFVIINRLARSRVMLQNYFNCVLLCSPLE